MKTINKLNHNNQAFSEIVLPVWMVKLAALEGQEHRREGLEPDEPVEGEGRGRVVGAVVERGYLVVLPAGVPGLKVLPPRWVQGADRLAQVPRN